MRQTLSFLFLSRYLTGKHSKQSIERRQANQRFCRWLIVLVCLLVAGCSKQETNVKKTSLVIYIDRSESIKWYQHGGLTGIHSDYKKVAQAFCKPIMQKHDDVNVEIRDFVRDARILYSFKDRDKWEQIQRPLFDCIDQPPYPASAQSLTRFSVLLNNLNQTVLPENAAMGREVFCLVLTDGKPDDKYKDILAAAQRLSKSPHKAKLRALLIAPVYSDMPKPPPKNASKNKSLNKSPKRESKWREDLNANLLPLNATSNLSIVNGEDYSGNIKELLSKILD